MCNHEGIGFAKWDKKEPDLLKKVWFSLFHAACFMAKINL
jgi:hypothetical protein